MPLYQFRTNEAEKTFLFIHVPKTGGTAIESFFRKIGLTGYFDPPTYMAVRPFLRTPPAHYDYDAADRLYVLENLYSFAVVRHPVKRMVSEYKWATEKSTQADFVTKMSFSEYLEHMFRLYRHDENVASGHFKPQVRFVGPKVKKIFKYEAGLEKVITQVLQDVGLRFDGQLKLPMVNSTAAREVSLTKADLDLIREFYAEDFAAFDYKSE